MQWESVTFRKGFSRRDDEYGDIQEDLRAAGGLCVQAGGDVDADDEDDDDDDDDDYRDDDAAAAASAAAAAAADDDDDDDDDADDDEDDARESQHTTGTFA
jgi:hypothetical protein